LIRAGVFAGVTLWLTPVLAVGVHAFGPSLIPALAIGCAGAAAIAWVTCGALANALRPAMKSRMLVGALVVFATVAIVSIARISVYMADPSRTDCSYVSDSWRTAHSCMTAYAEAARFASEGTHNIYDMSLYEPRRIGPLKADSYHYPPPFLLLPAAVRLVGADIFQVRALWFTLQSLVLASTLLWLACWIGGRPGAHAIVGAVFAMATPHVVYALQQGNFQSTAVPLAVAAPVLVYTARAKGGAAFLAFTAASKIFPGVLIVYLLAARRWRALAWTAVVGAALLVVTAAAFGTKPFADFIRDEVPRISSGASFPQTERPDTIPSNHSVYGMTVRLRALGLGWLTEPRGLAIASVYGLLVLALAAFAGWKHAVNPSNPAGRARLVTAALALVCLASFRSPFIGVYGLLGTVWLMTLLAAGLRTTGSFLGALVLVALFCVAGWLVPGPGHAPTAIALIVSGMVFLVALCVNVYALTPSRRRQPVHECAERVNRGIVKISTEC
jgi:alpha-1,2-mannosyltransferase